MGSNVGGQMAGLGQGLSSLRQGDVNNMMGVGGMQQGQNQAGMDLAYQNFVGQYNLPAQLIGQAGQTAAGMAPTLGGTTLAQGSSSGGSNSMMQGLGGAIAAYGALRGQPGQQQTMQNMGPQQVGPGGGQQMYGGQSMYDRLQSQQQLRPTR